jgi:hypothetical protein
MDDGTSPNGHDAPVRVKFGPKPSQELPLEWAQEMLTRWRARDPKRWGEQLAEIVTEDVPRPERGRS